MTSGFFLLSRFISRQMSSDARASPPGDRKSTRLNSSHGYISYAVFCLKKKKITHPASTDAVDLGASRAFPLHLLIQRAHVGYTDISFSYYVSPLDVCGRRAARLLLHAD